MFQGWNERLARHRLLAMAVLFLLAFLVYAGTVGNGFVHDDEALILENPYVQNPRLWRGIFLRGFWSFQGGAGNPNFYRPLSLFYYWLLYRLAEPNPAVFHLVQLLLNAATVVLVFRLGKTLAQDDAVGFAGGLLWSLHPLHVEAVCWISGMQDLGCGGLYVLAFLLFLRGEAKTRHPLVWRALSVLAFFSALLFKEMAVSFPLLLAAYFTFVPTEGSWKGKAGRVSPYVLTLLVYVAIRIAALGHLSAAPQVWRVSWEVLGAGLGLMGQHARLFFWPAGLSVFRTFEVGPSLRSPWPWLVLLALASVWRLRKRKPLFSFLVFWWLIALLPCLDVRQLSIPLLAERFDYLPTVGLCLAPAYALRVWLPQSAASKRLAAVGVAGLLAVSLVWAFLVSRAVGHWHNDDTLLAYSLKVSPDSALIRFKHAMDLQYRYGDLEGAVREYLLALDLNRTSFHSEPAITYDCYLGLGQVALVKGRREEAVSYFKQATRLLPHSGLAYDYLGTVYFPVGKYAQAAEYFQAAVKCNALDFVGHFYLGACQMKLGRYQEAADEFRAARKVDPTAYQAYEAEALALEAAGNKAEAAKVRSQKPKP